MLASFLLVACVSGPEFDSAVYLQRSTPEQAANDIGVYRGTKVLWGGLLLSSTTLEQSTQFELLAYPLDSKQRPNTAKTALGRFILVLDGFLEPFDYAEGRVITATGRLTETKEGVVGAARYQFPVVEAEDIYLWPKRSGSSEPRVQFGFGFIFDG